VYEALPSVPCPPCSFCLCRKTTPQVSGTYPFNPFQPKYPRGVVQLSKSRNSCNSLREPHRTAQQKPLGFLKLLQLLQRLFKLALTARSALLCTPCFCRTTTSQHTTTPMGSGFLLRDSTHGWKRSHFSRTGLKSSMLLPPAGSSPSTTCV
jgi:hypothetical protein